MIKIGFAGNPNVGKTALINGIAGSKLKVGNWPGVTIEKKEAFLSYGGEELQLVDLPGTYSLTPYSMDEVVTRNYILEEKPDVIINVVDSTNLERNLYLTTLLKELGVPMVMALNFADEFDKFGYKIDLKKFEKFLEIPVVMTSSIKKIGLDELLKKSMATAKEHKNQNHLKYELGFEHLLESTIQKTKDIIGATFTEKNSKAIYPLEFLAIKLLEEDDEIVEYLSDNLTVADFNKVDTLKKDVVQHFGDDLPSLLSQSRYGAIKGILALTFKTPTEDRHAFTNTLDKIFLNKIIGLPIFFMIIACTLVVIFNGSAPFIDWLDGFIGGFISKYIGMGVEGTPEWLSSLVVDGIVGGVGGVLVFVPLMFFLYFFLAILEESGYMSRIAFLMDKLMSKLGLNGKAFVPMVLGFGCTVPAIYATRTLEDEKSKKLTAIMAPFMSCGARLPVYGLFAAAFFGKNAGLVVLSMYLLGIFISILTGLVIKNFSSFKADDTSILIELPPYRFPGLKNILSSAWTRTLLYLKKATGIIMGILILLWALTYFPNNGEADKSYMASFGKTFAPIMSPTGFGDSWEAVSAIPPSIAAKEVVVGYLAQVLPLEGGEVEKAEAESTTFMADVKDQAIGLGVATIDSVKGIISLDLTSLFTPPSAEEVEEEGGGLIEATSKIWEGDPKGPLKAYSFMAFILLVIPCVVTLAAIKQELGTKFLFIVIIILTIVPYLTSTLIYQIGSLLY